MYIHMYISIYICVKLTKPPTFRSNFGGASSRLKLGFGRLYLAAQNARNWGAHMPLGLTAGPPALDVSGGAGGLAS